MAINPMQRKARQSFFIGVVVTLLLSLIVIFFLYNQIQNLNKELKAKGGELVDIFVLNQDVTSGQILTSDMFITKKVDIGTIPSNATTDIYSTLAAYALADENGNTIYTTTDGTGNVSMYIITDDGNKQAITEDKDTGKLYINGTEIKTTEKPLMAKIDLKANTVITGSMIAPSDEMVKDDTREQTYNMISLPIDLITGDYVDIRFMLPNGQDFIVLSKKMVTVPDVNGEYLTDTIKLSMSEGDLLTLSSAIVEAYQIEGSKLYAIKYTEAGNQAAAVETYMPTNDVIKLIQNDPNIVSKAMLEIKQRWTSSAQYFREEKLNKADRDEEAGVSGVQESTQATQEAREEYLSTIFAY